MFAKTLILLSLMSSPVFADAYKCKQSDGKIIIASMPCPETSAQIKAVPNSSSSQAQYNQAQADLNRQRNWLNSRQVQQSSEARSVPLAPQYIHGDSEKIHRCLMSVTSSSGLSPYTAARRRVDCFQGTQGRSAECESSVAATPMLAMQDERNLQAVCRNFQ